MLMKDEEKQRSCTLLASALSFRERLAAFQSRPVASLRYSKPRRGGCALGAGCTHSHLALSLLCAAVSEEAPP